MARIPRPEDVIDQGPVVEPRIGVDADELLTAIARERITEATRDGSAALQNVRAKAALRRPHPLAVQLLAAQGAGYVELPQEILDAAQLAVTLAERGAELTRLRDERRAAEVKESRRILEAFTREAASGKPVSEWKAPRAGKDLSLDPDLDAKTVAVGKAKAQVEHAFKQLADYEIVWPALIRGHIANVQNVPDENTATHAEWKAFADRAVAAGKALHDINGAFAREIGFDANQVKDLRQLGLEGYGIAHLGDFVAAGNGFLPKSQIRITAEDLAKPEPPDIADLELIELGDDTELAVA